MLYYKMWQFLVAVKEKLHALDSKLVRLVHEAPANCRVCSRYWILLRSDICEWFGVGIQLVGYLRRDLIASNSIATLISELAIEHNLLAW